MRIDIHDVGHGGCTVISGPQGHRLMLDCGLSVERAWFPSVAYHGKRIDTLVLMNLDEDHCEDLPYVWRNCPLGAIVSNSTVSAGALRSMKAECGMRDGVNAATAILQHFGDGMIGDWSHNLGGVQWHAFWNCYGIDFDDTNNLSLAVFVCFGGFTILFGGDLERAGWRKLLERPAFRAMLPTVNVYVASHHGRENGCCDELFRLCRPQLVIFSDGPKQYGTQETLGWYANRAIGIPLASALVV
jgi:beta-lactamase superfamily II metal-dependent hydrolase